MHRPQPALDMNEWTRFVRHVFCVLYALALLTRPPYTLAIQCFKCNNEFGTCDTGECSGAACVTTEQRSEATGQRSVRKGCAMEVQETKCTVTKSEGTSITMMQCSCLFDHCNSDEQLDQLGLKDASLSNSAASTVSILDGLPRRQTFDGGGLTTGGLSFTANHLIMLIFLFLFLTGSFSLLIMNTVCVHLCYQ